MDKRPYKDAAYGYIAQVAQALAQGHRLELLDLLANGEKRVDEIAAEAGLSVANASRHLQILRQAQLLTLRQAGNARYYRLARPEVHALWLALRNLSLDQDAALRQLVDDYRAAQGSAASQPYATLAQGPEVCLIDVRPRAEYEAGALPDALSIPLEELPERWTELPRDRPIVACCRGPFCTYADEAVAFLQAQGLTASRLEESVAEAREAFAR